MDARQIAQFSKHSGTDPSHSRRSAASSRFCSSASAMLSRTSSGSATAGGGGPPLDTCQWGYFMHTELLADAVEHRRHYTDFPRALSARLIRSGPLNFSPQTGAGPQSRGELARSRAPRRARFSADQAPLPREDPGPGTGRRQDPRSGAWASLLQAVRKQSMSASCRTKTM